MGLFEGHAEYVARRCLDRRIRGRVLTLGRIDVFLTLPRFIGLMERLGLAEGVDGVPVFKDADIARAVDALITGGGHLRTFCNPGIQAEPIVSDRLFFTALGFETVDAVDIGDHEGANLIFDLNADDIRSHIPDEYDLVLDCGTMEHVFDVARVFRHLFEVTRIGGHIIHIMPGNNFYDHGFYQLSPTLFRDYYFHNKFDLVDVSVMEYHSNTYSAPSDPLVERWDRYRSWRYDMDLMAPASFGQLTNALYYTLACGNCPPTPRIAMPFRLAGDAAPCPGRVLLSGRGSGLGWIDWLWEARLSGGEQGLAVEGFADGFEGCDALSAPGFDHGSHVGKEFRPLVGSEAVDDLEEDFREPQALFGAVVGGWHRTVGDEHEEMGAEFHALPAQRHPDLTSRLQFEGGVEAAVERGAILLEGAVSEVRTPMTDPDRILQDFLDHRSERGVAALDGVLDIPELVRKANLPIHLGPPLLRAEPVRHPEVWAEFTEKLGHHVLLARCPDDVDASLGVLEHPLPTVDLIDPDRGLVAAYDAAHDGGLEQPSFDAIGLIGKSGHRPFEDIPDRALADLQAEHRSKQSSKTLKTDRLIVVKVHRQCRHRRPERRSRLQALGHRRQELFPATRTDPAMALNLRHHRLDRRNLNPLVELLQRLVVRRHRRRAVRTDLGNGDMGMVRCVAQLPADPRMRRLGPLLGHFAGRPVGLLSPRRRYAGVGRRLDRALQFCLKLRNPRLEFLVLGGQFTLLSGECAVLAQKTLNCGPQFRRKRVGAQRGECGRRRQMTHDSLNRVGKAESSRMFSP